MQFYLDGYKPGDPLMHERHASVGERPDGPPPEVDVLIVGKVP
jgi:phenol 2-monooxygenase